MPVAHQFRGQLILSRELLGRHATADAAKAPLLTWTGTDARVRVRKKDRFVFGVPGRSFEDLPGPAGALGRYWTWVSHPDLNQTLAFMPRRPPQQASYHEGRLRLYRLHVRLLRGNAEKSLRISPPCIVVAGLGAVELAGSENSTRLTKPEPIAKFDLDSLRDRLQSLPPTKTKIATPCVVPNCPDWLENEAQVIALLTSTLEAAYKKDPPDWLLLPCYLPGSVPGVILARRNDSGWVFTSSDTTLGGGTMDTTQSERMAYDRENAGGEPGGGPTPAANHHDRPPVLQDQPSEFAHGDYTVHFENKTILKAARELILNGKDYQPDGTRRRAATIGAWRRAACVYALQLRSSPLRDLRESGWSDGMARCVEDFADDLGVDAREWLRKKDGPRTFADQFTVRIGEALAPNATEALAALLDALVRPHGRTKTGN